MDEGTNAGRPFLIDLVSNFFLSLHWAFCASTQSLNHMHTVFNTQDTLDTLLQLLHVVFLAWFGWHSRNTSRVPAPKHWRGADWPKLFCGNCCLCGGLGPRI